MKVVTIGLGYIGLPTSALIASKSIHVHGVDINKDVVETINQGRIHIVEPELDVVVQSVVENGFLKASTDPVEGDVYLIVVPTPFKGNHEPDISYVEAATRSVLTLLKPGDLYIIESTSPIGTTEQMAELIFHERSDLKDKIHIAYCPERVLPGNVMYELVNNDRVIGGINESSTDAAVSFYSKIVQGELHRTNARTAEMCKLVENSSRDVQIAFANELSLICNKADIDVWELINLANKHPRVNILQPGCGVGGHCIAVDPYFITSKFPLESKIIGSAREINNYKTFWCLEMINQTIAGFENTFGRKPTIAILGLAFKPNIDDLRESPALHIAEKMYATYPKEKVHLVEPNIKTHNGLPITPIEVAMKESDLFFVLVGHKEFIKLKSPNIISFVNIS
ncbi:UDP-N-acetyl-D-mannosamine dehydrogenase [Schleiferiaceae bacterium]|nr:UDP-N-acetyl-D-mannosamine dehydrogenase [Schleiferiaceae bacterium]